MKNNFTDLRLHLLQLLCIAFLVPCLLLCPKAPVCASDRLVRVGFFPVANFQEYDQQTNNRRGYAYEYVQALAQYSGWKLEFVRASYDECLKMLSRGEIDFMMYVNNVSTSLPNIRLVSNPYAQNQLCLVAAPSNFSASSKVYAELQGLKVGLLKGDSSNSDFHDYCYVNSLKPTTVIFNTEKELSEAMSKGKIDACLRCKLEIENMRDLCEFVSKHDYFAVRNNDPSLAIELRRALGRLHDTYPAIDSVLYEKYYSKQKNSIALSPEEVRFIKNNGAVKVSYDASWYPLSFRNKEGAFDGAVAGVYRKITALTGLRFTFLPSDTLVDVFACFTSGKTQMMAELPFDFNWAANKNGRVTAPFAHIIVVAAYKKDGASNNVVALPSGFYQEYLSKVVMKDRFTFRHYKTIEDCINAVLNGEAQYVLLNTYQLEYYRGRARYRDLSFKVFTNMDYQLSIAVSKASDPCLFSIINKALTAIGPDQIADILRNTSLTAESRSVSDILYANTSLAVTVFGLAGILLTLLIGGSIYFIQMKKKNKLIEAATSAKKEFFAAVSHDMRAPLSGVLGYAKLAHETADMREKQQYLDKLQVSGNLLLGLINDTLDFSKLENRKLSLNLQPMRTGELTESVEVVAASLAAARGVSFSITREPRCDCCVEADKLRLQQIFVNLLSNAIKFTQSGGSVSISFAEKDEGASVAYLVVVKDNGIGISREFLPRIYDAYAQEHTHATSRVMGTGLGLTIVKQLVDLMGGTISAESEPGRGTVFTVNLRLRKSQETAAAEKKDAAPEADLSGRAVLLCEDDELNAELVRTVLEQWGMKVMLAVNGKDGVDKFAASQEGSFDLILMDRRMPVMDGIEATRQIRTMKRADAVSVPIIAMTGDVDEESVQACLAAGMNSHTPKPIELDKLRETIGKFICG